MKKLLLGNQAMAWGAIEAGVQVATGYPGTPSTEVLENVAKHSGLHIQWSVNEKAALEVAAGASYAGARSLVTMKQVGLNAASDPLMSLAYVGIKGGMVVLVADDPGPMSSQTEQDTRFFGRYANLPVLDPATPTEAYHMMKFAFGFSEKIGKPVILRPTTRICHGSETMQLAEQRETVEISGFVKDPRWVIFPPLAFKRHQELAEKLPEWGEELGQLPFNYLQKSSSRLGVVTGGCTTAFVEEIIDTYALPLNLLKIGTPQPFPAKLAGEFLSLCDRVVVLEELSPVLEEALVETAYKQKLSVEIQGKKTGDCPWAGELGYEKVLKALADFAGLDIPETPEADLTLPGRTPVLCAGCPHRAAFYAVKTASGEKGIYTGDIGCYTLGNAPPLNMTDTCLCMGAGLTIAQGLKIAQPEQPLFAFIGDSTFFHSGITGAINAVYNQTDINIMILDNSTTAMTGHQTHPGLGKTLMGEAVEPISILKILQAIGIPVREVNPFAQDQATEAVRWAMRQPGTAAVIFKAPCVNLFKSNRKYQIDLDTCIGCHLCINKLGCPAMYVLEGEIEVQIDSSLCNGCGLCTNVCKLGAIQKQGDE